MPLQRPWWLVDHHGLGLLIVLNCISLVLTFGSSLCGGAGQPVGGVDLAAAEVHAAKVLLLAVAAHQLADGQVVPLHGVALKGHTNL